jgi:hypothetical protein
VRGTGRARGTKAEIAAAVTMAMTASVANSAGHHQRAAGDRAEQVADPLGAAVAAEQPPASLPPAQRGDGRRGRRGEGRRAGALGQARRREQVRVAADHERGRGRREQHKAVGHHRLSPGAVGQRAEDRFEHHLGAVVDPQQQAQLPQRAVVAQGVAPQVGGDRMGAGGGDKPGRVDRDHLAADHGGGGGLGHGRSRA